MPMASFDLVLPEHMIVPLVCGDCAAPACSGITPEVRARHGLQWDEHGRDVGVWSETKSTHSECI